MKITHTHTHTWISVFYIDADNTVGLSYIQVWPQETGKYEFIVPCLELSIFCIILLSTITTICAEFKWPLTKKIIILPFNAYDVFWFSNIVIQYAFHSRCRYKTDMSWYALRTSEAFTHNSSIAQDYMQYPSARQMWTEYISAPTPITRLINLPSASIAFGPNDMRVVID